MSRYYYLIAQLPSMTGDSTSSITFDRFREVASRFLCEEDLSVLGKLSLEPPREPLSTGSRVLDGWFEFERSLRLSLERARAARVKRELAPSGEDDSSIYAAQDAAAIARVAVGIDNPLEAERYLGKARFEAIERAGSLHYFDAEAVFAYGLALLVKERSAKFAPEAGRAAYDGIYKRILGE